MTILCALLALLIANLVIANLKTYPLLHLDCRAQTSIISTFEQLILEFIISLQPEYLRNKKIYIYFTLYEHCYFFTLNQHD